MRAFFRRLNLKHSISSLLINATLDEQFIIGPLSLELKVNYVASLRLGCVFRAGRSRVLHLLLRNVPTDVQDFRIAFMQA